MSDRAPYSRVYWAIRNDTKFDTIRGDDHHLATWLRLLIAADMAYPAPADLPATARKASVSALVDALLIRLVPGGMYEVCGLASEREKRSDPGRTAAAKRWHSDGNANALLAEPSKAEQSRAETPREDPASDYWSLTGRYPKDAALSWIDRLTETYGAEATTRALVKAYTADRATNTLLGRTEDLLRADSRQLDRKERAEEQARLREKRAQPLELDAWKDEYRRLVEEKYGGAA